MMQFKPNIHLELKVETKLCHFSLIHIPSLLTPTLLQISINEITSHDNIHAQNQKLFISLTDKWYIWLVVYLKMEIKLNIDL